MKAKKELFSATDVLHIFRQVHRHLFLNPFKLSYVNTCDSVPYLYDTMMCFIKKNSFKGLKKSNSNSISQLCDGLKHLHSLDPPYAHNDVKPGNVLITHRKAQPPLAILMDFGSTRPARRKIRSRSEALQL